MKTKLVKESIEYNDKTIEIIGDKVISNLISELDNLNYSEEEIKARLSEIAEMDVNELEDRITEEAEIYFKSEDDIDKKFKTKVVEYIYDTLDGDDIDLDVDEYMIDDEDDEDEYSHDYDRSSIMKRYAGDPKDHQYSKDYKRKDIKIGNYAPEVKEPKTPKVPKEKKKYPAPLWNKAKYNKWVKDMSWYEGDEAPEDYGYEMAQNAEFEDGLIDYVRNVIKREGGNEKPLERIQWDIESNL